MAIGKYEDTILIGFDNGILQKHNEEKLLKSCRAHESAIDALFVHKNVVITGGKDFCLTFTEADHLERITQFNLIKKFKELNYPSVRAIQFAENERKLIIGTAGGEIIELELSSTKMDKLLQIKSKNIIMTGPSSLNIEKNNLTLGFETFNE